MVHWRWSGYYDCVDADLFSDDVENVDGQVVNSSYVWNKIDHCQYAAPFRRTTTTCMPINDSATPCVDAMSTPFFSNADNRLNRYGVNVVPLRSPPSMQFPDAPMNINWVSSACANTDFSALTGTDTFNSVDLAARVGSPLAGRTCSGSNIAWQSMYTIH